MIENKDERRQKAEELLELQAKLDSLPDVDKRYIAGYVDGKLDEKLRRQEERKGS